jgi:hypothetical protein
MAIRIMRIWPRGGIATDVWTEELIKLDYQRARQALSELKRSEDHSPSLARFYARYASHAPHANKIDCTNCEGSGWVAVEGARRHGPYCTTPAECECHAAEPCRCLAGERMNDVYRRILTHATTR